MTTKEFLDSLTKEQLEACAALVGDAISSTLNRTIHADTHAMDAEVRNAITVARLVNAPHALSEAINKIEYCLVSIELKATPHLQDKVSLYMAEKVVEALKEGTSTSMSQVAVEIPSDLQLEVMKGMAAEVKKMFGPKTAPSMVIVKGGNGDQGN